jgi:PAS domain S-box-containing protein
MTDADGIVTDWNVGAEHILGYTAEEIIGKDAAKVFTLEDRGKSVPEKELETAASVGRAEDERWHVRRDGSRFRASGVVTAVRDPNGTLIGFSKVMRDMTERNKLAQERDRFFALSMDMLSIIHLDGRFQRVNPGFQETLGFSEEEFMSMDNRLRSKDATYKWVAWIEFPLMSAEVMAANAARTQGPDQPRPTADFWADALEAKLRNVRILMVEDDPDTQEL